MEKRTMNVTVGDWGDDGHGKTRIVTYLIEGDNVSDEHLIKTFKKNCERTGYNPLDECRDYEESSFSIQFLDNLSQFGIQINEKTFPYIRGDIEIYSLYLGEDEEEVEVYIPLSKILELYLEVKITVIPEPKSLIGDYNGLLKNTNNVSSFGYGLFF